MLASKSNQKMSIEILVSSVRRHWNSRDKILYYPKYLYMLQHVLVKCEGREEESVATLSKTYSDRSKWGIVGGFSSILRLRSNHLLHTYQAAINSIHCQFSRLCLELHDTWDWTTRSEAFLKPQIFQDFEHLIMSAGIAYQDHSGLTASTDNPYDALLQTCEDDPVP